MKSLKQLAEEHKCDKAAEGHHTYDEAYEFHFAKFRDNPIKLLEIGVGGYDNPNEGGASLRMWKEWFTNQETQIYSIDIFEKSKIQEDRIHIFQGSQSDEAFLDMVMTDNGPVDIIIDDGSHVNDDVIISFRALFPHLNNGGIYVIEDVQTAYWDHYGGDLSGGFIRDFLDKVNGLNYKEIQTEQRGSGLQVYEPTFFDLNITSIHFYHNIIFIYKGDNSVTA
jgi:hypothetical protein